MKNIRRPLGRSLSMLLLLVPALLLVMPTTLYGQALDLVFANTDGNNRVCLNDGMGSFSVLAVLNTGAAPFAVDPSDLDNDKDIDALISANLGSDDVSIFDVLGGGNFSTATNLPVGDAPTDLVTDDFDGNGFGDIVTANSGDGTVSVVLNNGDGTFAPAVHLPVGDQPRSLTTIDLEGDADPDLAVVADNQLGQPAVLVLRNDLTGGQLIFAAADEQAAGDNPALVIAADLDVDGQEDLVTVNEAAGVAPGPASSSVDGRLNTTAIVVPCPWDCGVENGMVDINDFLTLLAQWGLVGSTCDVDGSGVGITDFLALLAHWGPCP